MRTFAPIPFLTGKKSTIQITFIIIIGAYVAKPYSGLWTRWIIKKTIKLRSMHSCDYYCIFNCLASAVSVNVKLHISAIPGKWNWSLFIQPCHVQYRSSSERITTPLQHLRYNISISGCSFLYAVQVLSNASRSEGWMNYAYS